MRLYGYEREEVSGMPTYKDWIKETDIHIDYFSAFIKAWIAFNSWYRSEYTERTDREIIDKIKSQNNRFKGAIETLLDINNTSESAVEFKNYLSKLQTALTNASIVTQERMGINRQISFSEIAVANPQTISEGDYRTTHYRVERTRSGIKTTVTKKDDSTVILFSFEQEVYDESALDMHADFRRLKAEQQGQCHAFYKEIVPYKSESVVCTDRDNNISFIQERSKVSRGIIEVLYLLRCSLMHGEVYPDTHSSTVYHYAYSILNLILKTFL